MGDKDTFPKRLAKLRLNPDALEEVRVDYRGERHTIPNAEGKRGSLQVFAYITTPDSRITPGGAMDGLGIFGGELLEEARAQRGRHPNIDLLDSIAGSGEDVPSYVIRRDSAKPMPVRLSRDRLEAIAGEFGTPFIIYDEAGIRNTLRRMNAAFSWNPGFKEFFAVKAAPNPYLLEICCQEGAGADCSSDPELDLANAAGIHGESIMFTSNDTPAHEFVHARQIGAIINFDDITHIPFFEENAGGLPGVVCVRYNPGPERVGNSIIGKPSEAKYGLTREQVFQALETMKRKGVRRFGLHAMVASNELNPEYHIETARMLFTLAREVNQRLGTNVEFVNLGGGWGVNYKPEQKPIDPDEIGKGIRAAYESMITAGGLPPIKIFMENGRFVTGPNGWLVARAVHEKNIYRTHIGVDASMADFMRPGVYGIYQHILVPGKEDLPHDKVYDITGSLCEGCDKFAVQRPLPEINRGDLVVLCDAGAHGRAMGFNYNAKLRCQELLLTSDGGVQAIRRPERKEDYFATLAFEGSKFSHLAGSSDSVN